jgi:hypothetical protein
MKMKLSLLMMMAAMTMVFTGCVNTLDDHAQFGIPFLVDDSVSQYDRSVPTVLEAARTVLTVNGELTADNSINHSLKGKVKDVTVYVRVDEVDVNKPISKVSVQARTKGGAADRELAQFIDKQIYARLVEMSQSN